MSFDTPSENRAFADKFHFNFPLLCDTEHNMGFAYGAAASGAPQHAQRIGVVIGPDGRIREWLPRVDAKTYPQDVLKRL